MDRILKAPFFRLLLPLLLGIVIQYYYHLGKWSMIPIVLGLGIMLFSFFISKLKRFGYQSGFGVGIYLVLIGLGLVSTMMRQQMSSFIYPDVSEVYSATVVDLPQEKPRSYAYKVKLNDSGKLIVCYFSKEDDLTGLRVGDVFTFFSQIQVFKNSGNPDEFDYARYMYNKGYSGMTFVRADSWQKEGVVASNLFIKAVQSRQYILNLHESFNLTNEEYGMLSALTLGYTDALSDDIVESFRATGVAHILAVSGMHVGIVFIVISSLLSFIPRHSQYGWIKQVTIILLLWAYVFVIGFPPSAVRACIMLSIFCIAVLARVKSYSYNTLFLTAFFMLIWNPFWLFYMGFQLSFLAVLSMMLLMPVLSNAMPVKNKYLRYFRDVFNMSLSVQLGVFPLCLYYFGTFPVYFFISNLLIIPLITLAVYNAVFIVILSGVGVLVPSLIGYVIYLPTCLFQLLIKCVTAISSFVEHLPYATLQNVNPSFSGLVLLWIIVVSSILFLLKRKSKALITLFVSIIAFLGVTIWSLIETKNSLFVYYNPNSVQIDFQSGYNKEEVTELEENKLIWLNGFRYLIVAHDEWKGQFVNERMKIEYLHLIGNNSVSLYTLDQVFEIDKVILDGSLSRKTQQRFVLECEKLRIPYYDVSDNGVLRIFF